MDVPQQIAPFIFGMPGGQARPLMSYAPAPDLRQWGAAGDGGNLPDWMVRRDFSIVPTEPAPEVPPPPDSTGAPGAGPDSSGTPYHGDFPGGSTGPIQAFPGTSVSPEAPDFSGARDVNPWMDPNAFDPDRLGSFGSSKPPGRSEFNEFASKWDFEADDSTWNNFKNWFNSRSDGGVLKDAGRVLTDFFLDQVIVAGGQKLGSLIGNAVMGPYGLVVGTLAGPALLNDLIGDKKAKLVADLFGGQLDMSDKMKGDLENDLTDSDKSPADRVKEIYSSPIPEPPGPPEGVEDFAKAPGTHLIDQHDPTSGAQRAGWSYTGDSKSPFSSVLADRDFSPQYGMQGWEPGAGYQANPGLSFSPYGPIQYDTSQGRGSTAVDDALKSLMDDLGITPDAGGEATGGSGSGGGGDGGSFPINRVMSLRLGGGHGQRDDKKRG